MIRYLFYFTLSLTSSGIFALILETKICWTFIIIAYFWTDLCLLDFITDLESDTLVHLNASLAGLKAVYGHMVYALPLSDTLKSFHITQLENAKCNWCT